MSMRFLQTIRKSIYDVAFYAAAKTESFGPALKQYALLILCMAILIAIPLYALSGFGLSQMKKAGDIRGRVLAIYPDELVLDFQDGKLASNVEEPYSIPVPPEFSGKAPKNLVVINTGGTVALADFDRYDTLAILGSDAVWTRNIQQNKIEIQKFDQFSKGSFVLTKQKATEFVDIALKVGKIVITILLIFLPLIIFACLWLGYLVYLLFGAVVIWIVAKIRKADLTYGQSYKIGLYLLTLPILYSIVTIGPLSMFHIPFGFTLILAVVAYANLAPKKTTGASSPSVVPKGEGTPEPPKEAGTEPAKGNVEEEKK